MYRHRSPPTSQARRAAAGWALVAASWGAAASAHGLEANRIQVVVHERTAEVVATPPSEFVAVADANHDGLLNVEEVRARRGEVLRALMDALVVTDADGRAGELDRSDVSVPRGDDEGARGSDFLRLTVVLRWPAPPGAIRLRCGFVMQHPVVVYATRADSLSRPGMLTLLGDPEYSTLATRQAEATVLRQTAAPAPVDATPRSTPTAANRVSPGLATIAVVLVTLSLAALLVARARLTPRSR